jgi:hypothetical protein
MGRRARGLPGHVHGRGERGQRRHVEGVWGFGLEDVAGARSRASVLGSALTTLIGPEPKHPPTGDGGEPGGGGTTAPPPPSPPVTTPPPAATGPKLGGGVSLRADSKRRVRVRVQCSSRIACRGVVRLTSGTGRAIRVLARTDYRVAAGRSATIRLTLTRSAARTLARSRKLPATISLAGAEGAGARRNVVVR